MTDPQERLDAEARADDEAPTEAAVAPAAEPTPVGPQLADEPAAVATAPAAEQSADPVVAGTVPAPRSQARASRTPPPRASTPYAIIETGGKQYRVSVGDSLAVEKLPVEAGGDLTIDRVLLLGGDGAPRVGSPTVPGAAVTARVEDHYRGEKIVVFKYKAKKRYRRRMGHRQSLTRLTITGITG